MQAVDGVGRPVASPFDEARPAAEERVPGRRDGVLQAGAGEARGARQLGSLRPKRRGELAERLRERLPRLHQRDVAGGGVGVVRRLVEVDVVVRVDEPVLAAPPAEELLRGVRQDLVDVHVRRSAAAAVEAVNRELVEELPLQDRAGGGRDRVADRWSEKAGPDVGSRRGRLHREERRDELPVASDRPLSAERKILNGAPRLRPVESLGRHLDLSEKVLFDSKAPSVHLRRPPAFRVPRSCPDGAQ